MLVVYVTLVNRRNGGEVKELPSTTAWQQFPALLSAPAKSYLKQKMEKMEIPNKTDRGNI
jgi:hypothetical protein